MNCKLGDLAIIIGGDVPENIGSIVEVTARSQYKDRGYDWVITSHGSPLIGFDLDTREKRDVPAGAILHAPDRDLKPISGDLDGIDARDPIMKPELVDA